MHKHKQIRDKVVERLEESGGSSFTVYNSRRSNTPVRKLPAVFVHLGDENAEQTPSADGLVRLVDVFITSCVSGADAVEAKDTGEQPIDDDLDDIIEEIEEIFKKQNENLDQIVHWFRYQGVRRFEDTKSEDFILVGQQRWQARYQESL